MLLRGLPARLTVSFVLTLVLFVAVTTLAHAQATRTWVSGVGDDANPCSRTAPCKTFAGAISQTAAGGEIDTLDPGGFGAVTITKAITIDCTAGWGSVLASGVNAIVVQANASDVVVLRGCSLQGIGAGLNGVKVNAAGAVFLENAQISGFTGHAVDVEPSASTSLFITNSSLRGNVQSGVFVKGGGNVNVAIDGARIEDNAVGVNAQDNARVVIRDSTISNNATAGLQARPATGMSGEINAESVVVSFNGVGVQSGGGGGTAMVRLSNATVVDNTTGVASGAGGSVLSFVNNRIGGNGADGAPTTTKAQQ